MQKISFESVNFLVAKLERESLNLTDLNEIDLYCQQIIEVIESCGWDAEDFTERLMGWDQNALLN